jgi:membrane-bound lytic murein transglycosylase A
MPLPDSRPSAQIAKLFPQTDPLKDQPKDQKPKDGDNGAKPPAAAQPSSAVAQATPPADAAKPIPLPEARPGIKPDRDRRRHRHVSHDRYGR